MSNFLWRFADKVVLEARTTSSSRPRRRRQAGPLSRPIEPPSSTFQVSSLFHNGDVSHFRFSEPPTRFCRMLVWGLRHQRSPIAITPQVSCVHLDCFVEILTTSCEDIELRISPRPLTLEMVSKRAFEAHPDLL